MTSQEPLIASLAPREGEPCVSIAALFRHVDYGVVLTDLAGQSLFWNPAALAMHGLSEEAVTTEAAQGIELCNADGEPVRPVERPIQRILRGERLCGVELIARRGDQWQRVFSFSGSLVNDVGGRPRMALLSITDVTGRRRLEEQLRLRTEELQTLMEVAPVAIFVAKDPSCDSIIGNTTANAFTEAEAGENVSENARTLRRHFRNGRELSPAELPMQQAGARNILVRDADIDVLTPSGRTISMLGSASPLHDREGRVRGVVGAFLDITSRKRAEEALRASEGRLRTLLDNLFAFVALLTPDGVVREINRAPLEAAGIRAEDVLDRPFADCYWWSYSPDIQARIRDAIAQGLQGEVQRFDIDIRVAQGQHITIDFMLAPIRDARGSITHLLPSAVDVTARARSEQALRRKTEELSRINSELEAFSYSVSHDLRAPLRAINGYNGILREEYAGELPREAQGYLDRVHDATVRMGELIDGLLNLSRVIRSDLRFSQLNLSRLAAAMLESLREGEGGRQASIRIEPDVIAYGDPSLLRVLLENLLANAWKFTRGKAETRIEFGCTTLAGDKVFYIRDNGVGFDMQSAHKLFQPFERLHKHGEFAGTGIGLATVRRIVERHGGRVWAESGVDRGTTVYFSLGGADAGEP